MSVSRRRRKLDLSGWRAALQLERIYLRDKKRCFHCGKHVHRLDASREHLMPISCAPWFGNWRSLRGDWNVRLSHIGCNR